MLNEVVLTNFIFRCTGWPFSNRHTADQDVKFFKIFLNDINHGYRARKRFSRKLLYGCFRFICLWLLISIMKRYAVWSALQLYRILYFKNHITHRNLHVQISRIIQIQTVLCNTALILKLKHPVIYSGVLKFKWTFWMTFCILTTFYQFMTKPRLNYCSTKTTNWKWN